jgi:uncharacterized membrane protein
LTKEESVFDIGEHPAFIEVFEERTQKWQLRLADRITTFAGSMRFVWIHAVAFAVWMVFLEGDPWAKLTLIVSLEAIFLSTFVMIGQNRQADLAARKATRDFTEQEQELKKNTHLTEATHTNTLLIHLIAHKLGITEAEIKKALISPEPSVAP